MSEIEDRRLIHQEKLRELDEEFKLYRVTGERRMKRDDAFLNHWASNAWLAEARRDEMGRELAKAQARIGRQRKANREQLAALKEKSRRVDELEEVLGFYADEELYESVFFSDGPTVIEKDNGERARAALISGDEV